MPSLHRPISYAHTIYGNGALRVKGWNHVCKLCTISCFIFLLGTKKFIENRSSIITINMSNAVSIFNIMYRRHTISTDYVWGCYTCTHVLMYSTHNIFQMKDKKKQDKKAENTTCCSSTNAGDKTNKLLKLYTRKKDVQC